MINFSNDSADVIRNALKDIANIKYLDVHYSNNICPAITVRICFTPRENWINGIFENSNYRTFIFYPDGELKSISGYNVGKFRACHVKSTEEAANKLVKWVNEKALS